MHLPPSLFSMDIFNERLTILINQINAEHKCAYLTGDFNCNTYVHYQDVITIYLQILLKVYI